MSSPSKPVSKNRVSFAATDLSTRRLRSNSGVELPQDLSECFLCCMEQKWASCLVVDMLIFWCDMCDVNVMAGCSLTQLDINCNRKIFFNEANCFNFFFLSLQHLQMPWERPKQKSMPLPLLRRSTKLS